jgi:hypothetical protein
MNNIKKDALSFKDVLFYGIKMFFKNVQNIKDNRKLIKSWVSIILISVGGLFGGLLPFLINAIIEWVAYILQYQETNWLTNIITFCIFFVIGTSLGAVISKLSFNMYYFTKYNSTNIQYVPLSRLKKKYIIDVNQFQIKLEGRIYHLDENQIYSIDENIINIILSKKRATDRRQLKTAHERFRDGRVVEAMVTHAIIVYLIQNELNTTLNIPQEPKDLLSKVYTPIALNNNSEMYAYKIESDLSTKILVIKHQIQELMKYIEDLEECIEVADIPVDIKKNTSFNNNLNTLGNEGTATATTLSSLNNNTS